MNNKEAFSEQLRQAAGDQWERIVQHRFTTELAAGTIDRQVLGKYLVQDHRFLDAFVVLLASMVANARCLDDRIDGCQFLALITGKENTYFERAFVSLGLQEPDRRSVPNAPVTDRFLQLLKTVAQEGTLADMLAVLLVCEWTYLSWGQRVQSTTNRDDFVTYEWVDLHCGVYFEGVVLYLRALLDQEAQQHMTDAEKETCQQRFLQAVALEEEFFDFAYTRRQQKKDAFSKK